ncbi:hypothetical protein BKD03_01025 [Brucella sp. 09RB8471]|nr:hypothetical protein BKD03_01025 [Brucella sp. 09RB8471]
MAGHQSGSSENGDAGSIQNLFRRIYLTQNRCALLLEMLWPRAFERSPKMMFILGYRAVRKAKYSSLWIRSCYAK